MSAFDAGGLPIDLATELETRFFWWEPVGLQPRSHARILAQAMDLASFDDVRRLEKRLGPHRLTEVMLKAEPGWISERSWEFWRGRLTLATGWAIPDAPPRRSFDARQF
jgi:hypothetical protein